MQLNQPQPEQPVSLLLQKWDAPNFRDADLSRGCFELANLVNADFTGANLESAGLHGADLTDACLRDANIHAAIFADANLSGADMTGARGGWFSKGTCTEGTIFPDGTMEDIDNVIY